MTLRLLDSLPGQVRISDSQGAVYTMGPHLARQTADTMAAEAALVKRALVKMTLTAFRGRDYARLGWRQGGAATEAFSAALRIKADEAERLARQSAAVNGHG